MKLARTTMSWVWPSLLCATTLAQNGGTFTVTPHSFDGGMRSVSGVLEVSGTVGQPDAGRLAGGNLEITGGFWVDVQPGDINADGTVSLADHAVLAGCLTGPAQSASAQCAASDLNGDGRVDLRDFALLQRIIR